MGNKLVPVTFTINGEEEYSFDSAYEAFKALDDSGYSGEHVILAVYNND